MRIIAAGAALIGALAALPVLVHAQTPAPPTPPRTPLPPTPPRIGRERIVIRMDSAWQNRASLGMSVAATGSRRDTLGVFVTRVVPGGPAERAGIIEGDRIASIGDVNLRLEAADVDDPYAAGLPAHRLARAVEKLAPGASVQVRVYADGRYRTVSATPARMADVYKGSDRFMGFGDGIRDMVLPPLEMIGPAIREGVDRAISAIPPDLDVRVQRIIREIPREVDVEVR